MTRQTEDLPAAMFIPGQRESFAQAVTEADVATLAGLMVDGEFLAGKNVVKSHLGRFGLPMLAVGMIFSLLYDRLPGPGAVCLSQSLEFLAPFFIGDTLRAVVEVTAWQPEKRLLTMRTYCFNQAEVQVITGQAILIIENL